MSKRIVIDWEYVWESLGPCESMANIEMRVETLVNKQIEEQEKTMSNLNKSAFPFQTEQTMEGWNGTKAGEMGLSKLEYTAIKIFCATICNDTFMKIDRRKFSIQQAKLLLQECEESE